MIGRAEERLGVALDYVREIAATDLGLLLRYNKIFGFLDPVRKVPPAAYHTARLRGAVAADCGTCVTAEINLAGLAGLPEALVDQVLSGHYDALPEDLAAVARLADSVVGRREDDAESRDAVRTHFGAAGLIELSFAMNGAALLPGIKRAMGYATACDLDGARRAAKAR
ncbi:MAG: hypothetical protein AAFY38_06855 [Pseudomonadota bacterium]